MGCFASFAQVTSGRFATTCLLMIGALVSGCGGSSEGEESTADAASATVSAAEVTGFGEVLSTSSGDSLYVLTADPPGGSKCVDACTEEFKPLVAEGAPTAGPGTKSSLLKTFKREDGGEQVLYNDRALYTHKGEGLISGAGEESDGGVWYLVSPDGEPIETTAAGGY